MNSDFDINSFISLYSLVCVGKGDEQIRLVDDAFAKICSMMNDLSIRVRVQAASILGNFTDVAPDFLEQTLDKKLMSNLRVIQVQLLHFLFYLKL